METLHSDSTIRATDLSVLDITLPTAILTTNILILGNHSKCIHDTCMHDDQFSLPQVAGTL